MINIRFRECCEACAHINPGYEITTNILGEPIAVIGCTHMCVCSEYEGEGALEEVAPSEIKGFCNADR